MLTVMGPQAASIISRDVLGLRVEETELSALKEGDGVQVADDLLAGLVDGPMDGPADGRDVGIFVLRTGDVATEAFDVLSDRGTITAIWRRLLETGASPIGHGVYQTLRVEAGRPALGFELGENTIPPEAGLSDRAIDHAKGCYTGQEVIVRIRDRGHVNRRLCGLLLGEGASPPPGTKIFEADGEKAVGVITSVAESPRAGGVIALGYVRREIETPGLVRVGSGETADVSAAQLQSARVRDLSEGWAFL
jgi:folate-binding protein YgfZ